MRNMSADIFIPARTSGHGQFTVDIDHEKAGWGYSGLRVVELEAGASQALETGDSELLVLPLAGSATVNVDGHDYELAGRPGVFQAVTDYLYVGRGKELTITSGTRLAKNSAI